ncbi:MAG: hypothetical protein OEV56_00545 [Dehalococcoidia bacterium]|nr:hypothetical protein [Dehalococcoidia bacterium]
MKKTLLHSIIGLTLVLGLILPMAVPVMASEVSSTKGRNPDDAPYEADETIHFVMTVTNPGNNSATNTLNNIWDTLPDGSIYWFIEEGVNPPLVQVPGTTTNFTLDYVVDCDDMEYDERLGYWLVRNSFAVNGTDSAFDDVYALVTSNTQVIPCEPVGGEAFPIGKLSILAPWIVLGAAIVTGAAILVRRRHARS